MLDENELKTVGALQSDDTISTVDDTLVDPLLKEQQLQAKQMRSALLSCKKNDINSAKTALQNIAVLQLYHQVGKMIKFTEQMDKIEDKLYDAIDMNISQMDSSDPATMLLLLKVQSQMQESMVLSQKILDPYMNIDLAAIAPPTEINETTSFGAAIIPKESRNIVRNGAQALLTELTELRNAEKPSQETEATESNDGNTGADTQ